MDAVFLDAAFFTGFLATFWAVLPAGLAVFLGLIAVMPYIVRGITGIDTLSVGGTGILIVVSVVLETVRQIESHLVMRNYEGF